MGHFHFPCFLFFDQLASLQHICVLLEYLCLNWEVQLKLFLTSSLIREAGRKRMFLLWREKKKADNSFILTGKGKFKLALPRTRKLMTLFPFESHWPKYEDEHIPWWQPFSHRCTKKKNIPAENLTDNKSFQILLMSTDASAVYQRKIGNHKNPHSIHPSFNLPPHIHDFFLKHSDSRQNILSWNRLTFRQENLSVF